MQTSPLKLFLNLIVAVSNYGTIQAFHVSTTNTLGKWRSPPVVINRHNNHHQQLMGMTRPDEYDPSDGFDLEAARQKLESLVGGASNAGNDETLVHEQEPERNIFVLWSGLFRGGEAGRTTDMTTESSASGTPYLEDVNLPEPPPPLTSIDRERREAEIELLSRLENGNDAIPDLWKLWFEERGNEAANRLRYAEDLTSNPRTWDEAEELLRELINEYGVYWAEPVNRLATLYYLQGKFKEAEALCKTVLAVKPWHFGALSGIVMVYAGLHDVESARYWAAHRLPTYADGASNRRREQWVEKALENAEQALLDAERRLQDSFGVKDDHTLNYKRTIMPSDFVNDEDAWQ